MELTFEKVGNQYVAEFQAPSDFNLHIEREEIGVLEVHQRGSEEGKYDFAWSTGVSGRKVVDYDFGALVYPKWIKVVSGSEVVNASVNFNEGGGSGNGSGEASTVEYLDVSGIDENFKRALLEFSFYVKVDANGSTAIALGAMTDARSNPDYIIALGVDTNASIINPNITTTVIGYIEMIGMLDMYNSIPRITKEQFYNLEV